MNSQKKKPIIYVMLLSLLYLLKLLVVKSALLIGKVFGQLKLIWKLSGMTLIGI